MPDLIYIKTAWLDLAGRYCKEVTAVKRLFKAMEEAYTEAQRHYHNLDHVESLLKLSAANAGALQYKDVIDFSIFYHDFVYRAGSGDNEDRSAFVAENALHQLGVIDKITAQVTAFIKATRSHSLLPGAEEDLKLFIDFDLSILSAERDVYSNYVRNIRREYSHLPTEQFALGRRGFIQRLLRQPYIFHSQRFREKDKEARKNMEWELEMGASMFAAG